MEEQRETSERPGMTSIVFTCAGATLKSLGMNNSRIWIMGLKHAVYHQIALAIGVLLIREELVARVCALALLRGCCFGCCSG